ncbi:hypothetical protein PQO03_01250 [Lentisphaera profundi]|uniref:Uncharacterized protein n=1 Tax=Lentisphaera profundi TaxID=1658616 RepID=A0ABY7VTJ7_9BACT|nr:hypothetical protein [Lentisphaera profundi]WDE96593.1 hypothetical protein PQO03_01250 [Lentisphaera profundi]
MSDNLTDKAGEQSLPSSAYKRGTGLKLIFALIAISALTPIITIVINKYNPAVFSTVQAPTEDQTLVQVTWMDQPRVDLQHVLIFPFAPPADEINITTGHDVASPKGFLGFFIRPRVIYYNNIELTHHQRKGKKFKKLMRFWFLLTLSDERGQYGKAYPIIPPQELYEQWQSKDKLEQTELWKSFLKPELDKFRERVIKGHIDKARPVNTSKMY